MERQTPSEVGPNEVRGIEALQMALRTGAPLRRRTLLGGEEPISPRAAWALWSRGIERELVCEMRET